MGSWAGIASGGRGRPKSGAPEGWTPGAGDGRDSRRDTLAGCQAATLGVKHLMGGQMQVGDGRARASGTLVRKRPERALKPRGDGLPQRLYGIRPSRFPSEVKVGCLAYRQVPLSRLLRHSLQNSPVVGLLVCSSYPLVGQFEQFEQKCHVSLPRRRR